MSEYVLDPVFGSAWPPMCCQIPNTGLRWIGAGDIEVSLSVDRLV